MTRIFQSIALAAAGLLAFAVAAIAQPEPSRTLTADQAVADLDRLYEGLSSADAGLFAATPQSVFDDRFAELRESYDGPVTLAHLFLDFQRFAALARHSHTRVEGLSPAWNEFVSGSPSVFPLAFYVAGAEVIVSGAPAESAVQPGDRILALEGEPNDVWLARLRQNVSADTPEFAYAQMEGGELYYIWLEYGARESFAVEIERAGEVQALNVEAIPLESYFERDTLEPGFSLAGREARMLTDDIAYLRPGAFSNLNAESLDEAYAPEALAAYVAFIDASFEEFVANGAAHLVLDLRDNPGGDNSFSDPVVAWFADAPFRFASEFRLRVSPEAIASNAARLTGTPEDEGTTSLQLARLYETAEPGSTILYELPYAEPREGTRFEGGVHVLVNRYSYSNAVTTAAMIQDYGFGLIYGEPTFDVATTYGAMEHFALPHTGFVVGFSKAHIIRPSGADVPHPLTPDVLLPVDAVRGPQDVTLDSLVERLSGG